MENVLNFMHFEIVEMLISVYAWKGIWDVFEFGIIEHLSPDIDEIKFFSIVICGIIGYFIFVFILIVEKLGIYLINKRKLFKKLNFKLDDINDTFLVNLFYLIGFVGLVSIWRTFFAGFDYFVLGSAHKKYIIIASHFSIFLFMYSIGLSTALNGPGGFDSPSVQEESENENVEFNFEKFLTIKYFS